ncbi:DUF3333 domain-containing protein [Vibrio metschnikovii]
MPVNVVLKRLYGAVGLALSFVLISVCFRFSKGIPAFWQATVSLNVYFDPEVINIEPKPVQLSSESA